MKTADIVVVGAGIQGASAAYNLAKRDYGRIVVLERGGREDLRGSTPRSASMVMQQTGNARLSELARRSYGILQTLESELGSPVPFVETGSILYGTAANPRGDKESSERILRTLLAEQNSLGIETEWIDAESLPDRSEGLLDGAETTCGIYCASDGYTDGIAVRNAYLAAFERLGGEVRFEMEARGIEADSGRVRGVALSDGSTISTDVVLNCAGVHADAVNTWVGAHLPLTVDRRYLAILEQPADVPQQFPIIEDLRHEWYFRPDSRGVLMGIGPTETLDAADMVDDDPKLNGLSMSLARGYLERFVPRLAEARFLEAWAGRRPMICHGSPDQPGDTMPRVGSVSNLEGMFQSAGWGAFGVTLAFVGGELAARRICDDDPSAELGA